uniref:Glutamine-dependent NAD(+) synthetase n=1 Tax=Chenopodium quinoa TaxID=63459 RepID=A0A803LWN3_CHEQI
MRLIKVATCNLNQWAMDIDCNLKNIKESISRAKDAGATIRLGPELEITGYGCEDHFLELDTVSHAKIIIIRPKMWLANDGNYRELHWFTSWKHTDQMVDFQLPPDIADAISQTIVPFGYGFIKFLDAIVAAEICEELFCPDLPHTQLALNGVEIFMNASGSHHQLRKLRMDAFIGATQARGGLYMYSNQQGCDGGRLYYDGCCCVVVNRDLVAQGSQFSLKDVEVVVAHVDLDAIASLRLSSSSFQQQQASKKVAVPFIVAPYKLCQSFHLKEPISCPPKTKYREHKPEEEMALGPACWLWDYLRRSEASGFLLPLSGGADSSSVAAIVGCMCQLVVKEIHNGDEQVKFDAVRIGQYPDGKFPTNSKDFAKHIFYTVFMRTENSSETTKSRAKKLADEIGSWHLDVCIDGVILALLTLFQTLTGKRPRYKVDGGSNVENLELQNIQARIRMVLAFMLALLMPWVHRKSGFYLVLGCTNVDEALRGYLTKYDCSSADINPIGSINKTDLRAFLRWAAVNLGYSSLAEVEAAPPTAELEPIRSDYTQDLSFRWGSKLTPSEIAEKVKYFFEHYSINRHNMTLLTPSYHAERYSPEDNRFDLRQFLYNSRWPFQFRKIDKLVKKINGDKVLPA